MAYSKPPKLAQDSGIGLQTLNQLAANQTALATAYSLEHGSPVSRTMRELPGMPRTGQPAPGEHNTPLVPRGVGSVVVSAYQYGSGTSQAFVDLELFGGCVVGVSRVVPGFYVLHTAGVMQHGWCEVTPLATGTQVRKALVRPSTVDGIAGFLVTLLELGAGTFSPADFSFGFAVFSP